MIRNRGLVLHHAPRSRSSRIIWLLEELGAPILSALRAGPYVLGERFSGADLLLVSMGQFSRAMLPAGDRVDAYLARAAARPALARALARDAG